MLNVSFDGLDELQKKVDSFRNNNTVLINAVKDYAEKTYEVAVEFTPIDRRYPDYYPYPEKLQHDPGDLKKHWQKPITVRYGNTVSSTVLNNAKYAYAVNYGHRQHPGQYVPALDRPLVQDFVTGLFITDAVENMMSTTHANYFSQQYSKYLDQHFKK